MSSPKEARASALSTRSHSQSAEHNHQPRRVECLKLLTAHKPEAGGLASLTVSVVHHSCPPSGAGRSLVWREGQRMLTTPAAHSLSRDCSSTFDFLKTTPCEVELCFLVRGARFLLSLQGSMAVPRLPKDVPRPQGLMCRLNSTICCRIGAPSASMSSGGSGSLPTGHKTLAHPYAAF
jgi:hypothetical protein